MKELEAALNGKYESGIYLFNTRAGVNEIADLVHRYNFCFLHLDGLLISNKVEFFDTFGSMINYPNFGMNYDRLVDVCRDLECWGKPRCCPETTQGLVVLYNGIQRFLQNDAQTLSEIVEMIYGCIDGFRVVGSDASGIAMMGEYPRFFLLKDGTLPDVAVMG